MNIVIIGTGDVGTTLAKGLRGHGHVISIATRSPEKLKPFADSEGITITSMKGAVSQDTDILLLAVKGSGASEALRLLGPESLKGKIIIDATNPLADSPPEQGVLSFFTDRNRSLMEALQAEWPDARFVKAFNSVGAASMIDPSFDGGKPTMFICGNDLEAKELVSRLLEDVGWEIADMGGAIAARAIEPLCILWCIPGFRSNEWTHAFKLLRR